MKLEDVINYFLEKIKSENDGNHVDFMVPGYLSKSLTTYQSMREDLILCLNAAQLLLEPSQNKTVETSLWHTIIILYGKCFTDASSSKSSKLEVKDCFNQESNEFLVAHENLMELRHNFVAHRGSTEHEFSFAYLSLNIHTYKRQALVKQVKRQAPNSKEIADYIKLISYLINVVESKFQRAAEKAWSHMLENYTPQQIAFLKVAGPTNTGGEL